jgi:hypothetical protein
MGLSGCRGLHLNAVHLGLAKDPLWRRVPVTHGDGRYAYNEQPQCRALEWQWVVLDVSRRRPRFVGSGRVPAPSQASVTVY